MSEFIQMLKIMSSDLHTQIPAMYITRPILHALQYAHLLNIHLTIIMHAIQISFPHKHFPVCQTLLITTNWIELMSMST